MTESNGVVSSGKSQLNGTKHTGMEPNGDLTASKKPFRTELVYTNILYMTLLTLGAFYGLYVGFKEATLMQTSMSMWQIV